MEQNQIVIYQTEDGQTQIDVRLENETVWLTQAQMAELFEKDQSVVARHLNNAIRDGELEESNMHFLHNTQLHIRNAYNEGELERESTCKEYLQVQTEGKIYSCKFITHV